LGLSFWANQERNDELIFSLQYYGEGWRSIETGGIDARKIAVLISVTFCLTDKAHLCIFESADSWKRNSISPPHSDHNNFNLKQSQSIWQKTISKSRFTYKNSKKELFLLSESISTKKMKVIEDILREVDMEVLRKAPHA